MIIEIIFVTSGLLVALILAAKIWEGQRRRSFFLLRLISRGDERVRTLAHTATFEYEQIKSEGAFLFKKQLPLQTKNLVNKINVFLAKESENFLTNIRGSRFLRKQDGLSEFFKNISEKESEGRIDETLEGTPKE